ncbi:MAG TPA: 2-oxoglutarate dehydrogenase complex dihydrolipoyllysine-residue succinyltransferase [Methylomirabilota bacterium]|nr:2-oxoglutarate dehydrogenase complex dihydrolipoyllysine-residue succinyltransferase [Methylomirabilota bacterium]
MTAELRIPQLGESVTEGTIARWLKADGDLVKADEPVLELETDKATMEIPAGASGRLQIVERDGAVVRVGTVVARITEEAGATAAPSRPPTPATPGTAPAAAVAPRAPAAATADRPAATPRAPAAGTADRPAAAPAARVAMPPAVGRPAGATPEPAAETPLSPAVRKLVAEYALDPGQLSGTGKGGRLTKGDVLRHLEQPPPSDARTPTAEPATAPEKTPAPAAPAPAPPAAAAPAAGREAEVSERRPMSTLRRRIAERLVEAQRTAAILTTFNEVDLSALLAARARYREAFRARHGVDLGLMSLFGRACIAALRDVPVVNARIDGGDIVYHRHVHLGIAVSTDRGLVVPVVRHADALSLADIERRIADLARRAREGKITPDDLSGGTFTITNGGVFGSLLSTPILNPPQSGILGMHKIQERPVAVGGQVVIRPMMYLALSYDHRLVDGAQAVTFLVRVKERLEDPVRMLLEV